MEFIQQWEKARDCELVVTLVADLLLRVVHVLTMTGTDRPHLHMNKLP